MHWKPGAGQLTLSGTIAALTWAWDIYAQAHAIPYTAPQWVIGIILAPYGGRIWAKVRDKIKLPEITKK